MTDDRVEVLMKEAVSKIVIAETADRKIAVHIKIDTDNAHPVLAILTMVINGLLGELKEFDDPKSAEALAYTCLANGSRLVACAREFFELANRDAAEATKH